MTILISRDLKQNNFDVIRLLLAVAVLYSHCYISYYGNMKLEPVSMFSNGQTELGVIAVYCFFIISGFLIARSFEQSDSVIQYLRKRALRIIPGFTIAFLISVLIVGPIGAIYSSNPNINWQHYFSDTRWPLVISNLFTLQAPTVGVCFTDLACPKRVNSSLWTIQHEALCYLLIPAMAMLGLLKRRALVLVAFIAALAVAIVLDLPQLVGIKYMSTKLFNYPGYFPKYAMYFLAGACCYLYRKILLRDRWFVLAALVAILASMQLGGFQIVFPFAGTYLLFHLAFDPRFVFSNFASRGDFSYGTYLYGWPVQQLVLYFFQEHLNIFTYFTIALVITLLCAFCSWHLVEKRFLQMKSMSAKVLA